MSGKVLKFWLVKLQTFKNEQYRFSIVVVNGGSFSEKGETKSEVLTTILNLKSNNGHQRTITVGLECFQPIL